MNETELSRVQEFRQLKKEIRGYQERLRGKFEQENAQERRKSAEGEKA